MKQTSRILSIYAADTAGVCSALYELGGMTVIHDASGCNSTYSTHDEPRWTKQESMIYISALTELDAVMGNDEKLIEDVSSTASSLHPRFITLCSSPVPVMIGTDFEAVAAAIEKRTGIPAVSIPTDGMHSYLVGASDAFRMLAARFCTADPAKAPGCTVNFLGATPLDFSDGPIVPSIRRWLVENGFTAGACFSMGSTPDELARAGGASVNLVLSWDGLAAARVLKARFGTPYVVGVPVGECFSRELAEAIRRAAESGADEITCSRRGGSGGTAVVGESVYAGSLACALSRDAGQSAFVLCPLETEPDFLAPGDKTAREEPEIEALFRGASAIVADPLYRPVCPVGTPFVPLAHEAFSGRCFHALMPDLIGKNLGKAGF